MAKYFATEAAQENALDCMRIHGGYGYSLEYRPERYYRDAPLLLIGEGSNEIQQLIIARRLLERSAMDFAQPPELAEIRSAVRELCARFPGEYWRGARARPRTPRSSSRALTEAAGSRRSIPEEYGGAGLGADGGERDPRGDQRLRRQLGRLPRADVHDGHDPAARLGGAEAALPAADRVGRAAAPGVRRDRADASAPTRPRSRRPRRGSTAAGRSAARRSGPRGRSTPT